MLNQRHGRHLGGKAALGIRLQVVHSRRAGNHGAACPAGRAANVLARGLPHGGGDLRRLDAAVSLAAQRDEHRAGFAQGQTLRTVRPHLRIIEVVATRGKHVRAEPIAALYSLDRISHVGTFQRLEDQMCQMTAGGYEGDGSPVHTRPVSPNGADQAAQKAAHLAPGGAAGCPNTEVITST